MNVELQLTNGAKLTAPLVDFNLTLYRKRSLSHEGDFKASFIGPVINMHPIPNGGTDELIKIDRSDAEYDFLCIYWQNENFNWKYEFYLSDKAKAGIAEQLDKYDIDHKNAYKKVIDHLFKYRQSYSGYSFFDNDTRYSEFEKRQGVSWNLSNEVGPDFGGTPHRCCIEMNPQRLYIDTGDEYYCHAVVSFGHSYGSIAALPITGGELIASGALNFKAEVWDNYNEYINGDSRF